MSLEEFFDRFDDFTDWDNKKIIDFISFFYTRDDGTAVITAGKIDEAVSGLDLKPYSRTAAYLSEESKNTKGKYIKQKTGYRLQRAEYHSIKKIVENEPRVIAVSEQLNNLVNQVKDSQELSFLHEAINCYKVQAYRASIVMVWTLTMDHLLKYVFGQRLNDFNLAITKCGDKKIKEVLDYENFGDIKDAKLIELMRGAGIISNDVRKILDMKLGIRNSVAHPSGITCLQPKATEFIGDLIDNVLLKY